MAWTGLLKHFLKNSMNNLIEKYDKLYTELQKALSNKLLKAKDELEIAKIRQQRAKLGELYQQTLVLLKD